MNTLVVLWENLGKYIIIIAAFFISIAVIKRVYPHIKVFRLRSAFRAGLKRLKNIKILQSTNFSLLNNEKAVPDLLIDAGDKLFCVKLFGTQKKINTIQIKTTAQLEFIRPASYKKAGGIPQTSAITLRYKFQERKIEINKILASQPNPPELVMAYLFIPKGATVVRLQNDVRSYPTNGDEIFGVRVYTEGSELLSALEKCDGNSRLTPEVAGKLVEYCSK